MFILCDQYNGPQGGGAFSAGASFIVGQGRIALAEGAGGDCLDVFLSYIFSFFFLPLWETVRYSLKGLLNPKQPTNQPIFGFGYWGTTKHKNRKTNVKNVSAI